VRLFALVTDSEGKVEAILLDYIENAKSLRDVEKLTSDQFHRWVDEMGQAISCLHSMGLVWGDAKAANVLIRGNDTVVLIDFGGGHTDGWVERKNSETIQGDWKGFDKISLFLRERVSETSS